MDSENNILVLPTEKEETRFEHSETERGMERDKGRDRARGGGDRGY